MTSTPPHGERDDHVALTPRQRRHADREAKRQAKDDAYEAKLARKKSKDVQFWRGRQVVDARGLAAAFPPSETPEYSKVTVRRRVTHGVTLVILLALVVAGVVLAGMLLRGQLELNLGFMKPVDPATVCPSETLKFPENKAVKVNVLNGGQTEGQAGKIAAELKKRGYIVGQIANLPTTYTAPVIVVAGSSGFSGALNVQRTFTGADFLQDDRKDATVDVVITDNYKGFIDPKKISKKDATLSCPRLSPTTRAPASAPVSVQPKVPAK